jgi:serine/threonine-protein kinase
MIGTTVSHYRILEKLGEGGMGIVYKAEDIQLKRTVALKFLPDRVNKDSTAKDRFLQEAQAAAALNNPNICTIHGVEDVDGSLFIVMEYVEGGTLREKLPFTKIDAAITIAVQIGEALQEAHSKGIVHRDIKADNIMLTSKGQAKVMDFGLAKLKGSLKLTKTSSTVGTLAYMAPEQIQGGEVDARSDIFSFGVLLFEMLTGHLPFRGEHEAAMVYSIVNEEPEPLQTYLPDAPSDLQHVLDEALEKDPEDRYQTVGEIVHELRRIRKHTTKVHRPTGSAMISGAESEIGVAVDHQPMTSRKKMPRRLILFGAGIVTTVIVCIGLYFLFFGNKKPIDSIAVLPFINVNADSTIEYLSDGITENIINSLTRLSNLRVIPRSTAFHYKGKEIDHSEVANKLKVRTLLTGKVIRGGNDLNIQVDLIDASTESQIWGEKYDRKLSELATVQEEIVRGVSQKLLPGLTGEEKAKMGRGQATSTEAIQLYMKGRFYWNKRTPEGLKTSVGYFEQAIQKDPTYALAYAGLADAYILLSEWWVYPAKECYPKAKDAALKALQIDNDLGEAHTSLAAILRDFEFDWSGAEREYKRAIALNPNYPTAHQWYAEYLGLTGRHQEALGEILKAQELDPLSLVINYVIGFVYYSDRQYEKTIEQCRKVFELDSSFAAAQSLFVDAYVQKGMNDQELAEVDKIREMAVGKAYNEKFNRIYKSAGWKGLARWDLAVWDSLSKHQRVFYTTYAYDYAVIGEKEKALHALEKSLEEREYGLLFLKVDPAYDSLRSDPRFIAILKKVGLEK